MAHKNRFPLVSLMALGFAMPALAQTPTAAPPPSPQAAPPAESRDRDVVIVTAQKREETVQDIAVAVTAITSEQRDQIGLTTVQDYTNFAPGLSYSTASDRLGMRGVSRTSNNFGIRSGISNYVDGVYFSSAIPASREPIFVDRVEVVRGPQGTLYGRDSIGGALNVISKRPTEETEGQFNIGIGDYQNLKVEGTMAGPITDWLRYRIGYNKTNQNEGYFNNKAGLESEGGRRDDSYIEGQLAGNIGDKFDWWVRVGSLSWNNRLGAPGARTSTDIFENWDTRSMVRQSTADLGPNPYYGLITPNRVQLGNVNSNPAITDRNSYSADFTNYAHLSPTSELATEAIYHAPGFDLKYLGGYVWYRYLLRQDQDGSAIKSYVCPDASCGTIGRTLFTARISDYEENRGWFSNELNFISTWDSPFQMTAGVYEYQENYAQVTNVSNVQNPGGPIINLAGAVQPELKNHTGFGPYSGAPSGDSLSFFTDNTALNNAYGAFLQTDYQLTDQIKLNAGIRWSKDLERGREYARVINHYVIQTQFGFPASVPRIDVTSTLGGADPATISAANPCGFAGRGVLNTNVTAANGAISGTGACASADKSRFGIYTDPLTGNAYRDLGANFQEVTGQLGVDWKPDTDTLLYAKYNRGYKPGGLGCSQVFCTLVATPFTDKELTNAYEGGFKKEWRDLHMTTDVVLFYDDYKGYQISNTIVPPDPGGGAVRPAPYSAYVNLPKTIISGVELETTWRPIDDFRILFNYGYTNPEIRESEALVHALDPYALDPAAQPLGARANAPATCAAAPVGSGLTNSCLGVQGQSLKGNILPFSPKNKIALNGVYTWNLGDGSHLDGSVSYFWQDIAFSSVFNRSYTKIPSWDQTDMRLSWTSSDNTWVLIGFVRNVFDDIVYDSKGSGLREGTYKQVAPTRCDSTPLTTQAFGALPAESCYTTGETLRPPRTIGAELQFHF